ncbi:MAG: lipid A-modifier LpxR family protein [Pseudomonadota bacterium]
MKLLSTFALAVCLAFPAIAQQERGFLGFSDLFNNDALGDGKDRWRTASYMASITWGEFNDGAPAVPFALVEYRLRADLITPVNLAGATAFPDRPYAGVIGLGAFTHIKRGQTNISFGGELAFVGPSTGLGDLQKALHDALGLQEPIVRGDQLPNKVYPTVSAEISRELRLGDTLIRPFFEAQAGIETYARVGVDTLIGRNYSRNFFLRDPVTGHLTTNVRASNTPGWGFALGADAAYVSDSKLLPSSRGYQVERTRLRARAGVAYEAKASRLFYGLTYHGKEFQGQSEGQVVGSLSLRFKF